MWKQLLKVFLTALLVGTVYLAADWRAVLRSLASLHGVPLAAALALFVPQTIVSALRWQGWASPVRRLSWGEAIRQTLASSAVNLVVPAKLGDLSKGAMLTSGDTSLAARATQLVVGEKIADLAALAAVLLLGGAAQLWGAPVLGAAAGCALGVAVGLWAVRRWFGGNAPPAPAAQAARWLWFDLATSSLLLWSLHVAQIDLFCRAAGVAVPWMVAAARIPLAVLAGLVPISLWGLGTRDTALVLLYQDVAPAATMAAVGSLTALRYLVPGLIGIPFLSQSVAAAGDTIRLRRKQRPERRRAA